MLSGSSSTAFVRPSVRSFVRTAGYLVNELSNVDEMYSEYSLAHKDDGIRYWRSKVKAGHGEGIHVDAEASKSVVF